MNRLIKCLIILVLMFNLGYPSTYLKFWVNGNEANVLTQGDFLAWEYDLSVVGGSALVQLVLDLDGSGTITDADNVLIRFEQTDGYAEEDGPPADSSLTPDGIVYSNIGPFGFAPATYIFQITDLNDNTEVSAQLQVNELTPVNVWFSGTVSITGVTPPSPELADIMIEAEADNMNLGFWSGLTDEYGNYVINLPDSAVNAAWELGFSFMDQIAGYHPDNEWLEAPQVNSGENGPYDFVLTKLSTCVYGDILNESMEVVPVMDGGALENLNSGENYGFRVENGHYEAYVGFAGDDTSDVPFQLGLWGMGLIPDYMVPITWEDSTYYLLLSKGDSVRLDVHVLATNEIIYAEVTRDDQPVTEPFRINAFNHELGYTRALTGDNGMAVLHVRDDSLYYIELAREEDGERLIPEGYIVENGNYRIGSAGDTVHFNLIPASSALHGRLLFSEDDPGLFDPENAEIVAYSGDWNNSWSAPIDRDSLSFTIYVPNDRFSVEFNSWSGDYLSRPVRYENISVENDTVDTLNFELNYAHAVIEVRLINAPLDDLPQWDWWSICTEGIYPYRYESGLPLTQDTVYQFRVCEGKWQIQPPLFDYQYSVFPEDTAIDVDPQENYYTLDVFYKKETGISEKEIIPDKFYVKQNYPNPFNPSTTIEFGLAKLGLVEVDIFDVSGRRVSSLLNATLKPGVHQVQWNAVNYASGMYIFRVKTNQGSIVKKLLLIK